MCGFLFSHQAPSFFRGLILPLVESSSWVLLADGRVSRSKNASFVGTSRRASKHVTPWNLLFDYIHISREYVRMASACFYETPGAISGSSGSRDLVVPLLCPGLSWPLHSLPGTRSIRSDSNQARNPDQGLLPKTRREHRRGRALEMFLQSLLG